MKTILEKWKIYGLNAINFWPIIRHISPILSELNPTDCYLEFGIYLKVFHIFRTTIPTQINIADTHDRVASWELGDIIKLGHFASNMNEIRLNTAIKADIDQLEAESL